MTLASRPARVTLRPAGPAPATTAPARPATAAPGLGPSLLGLGLGTRLAMAGAALAGLWSAIALGMS